MNKNSLKLERNAWVAFASQQSPHFPDLLLSLTADKYILEDKLDSSKKIIIQAYNVHISDSISFSSNWTFTHAIKLELKQSKTHQQSQNITYISYNKILVTIPREDTFSLLSTSDLSFLWSQASAKSFFLYCFWC